MNIKLIIAIHKNYPLPSDDIYLPLQMGAEGKEPLVIEERTLLGDNTGDHISGKNASYCELTGIYWAWKNLDADAIGLVHYRRYFTMQSKSACKKDWRSSVLSTREAEDLLKEYDIILPKKRKYYIESLYSHYAHTLDGSHLDLAREIIHETCPQYDDDLDKVYRRTWGYMFNMAIFKKSYFDAYCSWLFPILEELERRMEMQSATKDLTAFEARLYGRVSEILFNVWLLHMQNEVKDLRLKEVSTMHTEPVNWLKKGTAFLQAKFFGKKYKASF